MITFPRGTSRLSFEPIFYTDTNGDEYTFSPARYAKGKILFRLSRKQSASDWKTRGQRLVDSTDVGGKYTNREHGHVLSPAAAERLHRYLVDGWDASSYSGDLEPPEAEAHEPNEDQGWREKYARGYREAEARGLQPWQAREEASREAWADYEARTGRKPFERNGAGYFVWALARGSDEPIEEGPWGPYETLASAKTFARIGATEGKHDRAVSFGLDATTSSFRIVRRYEAGTGERLL